MPSVVHRPALLHRCRRSSTPTPTHCTNRRLHDGVELVERCRDELERQGMFHRLRLMRPAAVGRSIAEPRPLIDQHSFLHHRRHNVYFAASVCGLGDDHPALREFETTNRTVCADQMAPSPRWPSMNRPLSADSSSRSSRSTVACIGRRARIGRRGVVPGRGGPELAFRSSPVHHDAAAPATGVDPLVERDDPSPGTLTVFAGTNTAHRVTAVGGGRDRIVAVLSYAETPNFRYTDQERHEFYGRTGTL